MTTSLWRRRRRKRPPPSKGEGEGEDAEEDDKKCVDDDVLRTETTTERDTLSFIKP